MISKKTYTKALLCGLSGLAGLTVLSGITNASVYVKAYSGNTFANQDYVSKTPWISGGALFSLTERSSTNYANLFSAGAAIGLNQVVYNKVKLGAELEWFTQIPDVKFSEHIPPAVVSPTGGILAEIESRNDYNARASAVLTFADLFYLKAGPSYIKEKFKTSISDPVNVKKITFNNTQSFIGVNGGLGFNYQFNNIFSLFSEYNFTYYSKEKLPNIRIPAALIENPSAGFGDNSDYQGRSFRYTHSSVLLGIKADVFNF